MIKIKDFSELTGFSIRMLRYLEEMEVLIPKRENNNYRVYTEDQTLIARRIKKLQNLGVQLKEIQNLQRNNKEKQIEIIQHVLKREREISEMKSESIPELKNLLDSLKTDIDLNSFLDDPVKVNKKLRTLSGEDKFHRTAYSIPILKNIYEDHLTNEANIKLIQTDLLKFGEWFQTSDYLPDVFSVLMESTFVFGKNVNDSFIKGYETSWKKFLPNMGFKRLSDFSREDAQQLMGPHDIIIRSTFKYVDTNIEGEIVIPYSPIYTMSQLSNNV